MVDLRPYQDDLIESIRGAYRRGHSRVLAVAPTGSGKTVVFSYIAGKTLSMGRRTLILVHRAELIDQTSKTLAAFGVPHGIIASGRDEDAAQLIQVASVQTLIRRFDRVDIPDLIVIDEAHHSVAGSWRAVIEQFSDAKVLGVTATPERLDGKGLSGVFQSLILGPSVSDLMDGGHLSRARYFAPSTVDVSGVKSRCGDYDHKGLETVMDNPKIIGDAVEHYGRLARGMPAIAFCVSIKNARNVAEAFRAAGYAADTIDGTLSADDRRERVEMLADGRLSVLTSCEIVNEGFDVPVVGAAILLRPTKSLGLHLQQIGRVLRPAPGKTHAVILDHVGNLSRHGLAEEKRNWTLEDKPKRKKESEQAESIRQCVKCFACYSMTCSNCPECGHEHKTIGREIEQRDGELVEITIPEKPKWIDVAKARTYEDLVALGKSRGYKPGWARMVLRNRGKFK